METTYWQKQGSEPLFPDLLWSRPERRSAAGKLLIIGGNVHAFAAPAEAFMQAQQAGIGTVRVVLPDATKKLVGKLLEHLEYAPSTPSGSFGQKSLAELLDLAAWSDGVLMAGDIGRNSETAILLEKFVAKYPGQLTITKDSADYIVSSPEIVLHREYTLLVLSFAQLQKLASKAGFTSAFTFDMDILRFVSTLHEFTQTYAPHIIVKHHDQMHCAVNGAVVSTKLAEDTDIWRVKTAAHASVWWLQSPSKPLESLATSIATKTPLQ
jgi:hypothetical protein